MLDLPFTRKDFLSAAGPALDNLPENTLVERDKPRASGLVADAREQAYYMLGLPGDDYGVEGSDRAPDAVMTTEQGRMYEELLVRVIQRCGWDVADRQLSLPGAYPVTGHPDGRLSMRDTNVRANPLVRGVQLHHEKLNWGVEFKHLGRYKYRQILSRGLEAGAPDYILQSALYADALNWDAVLFVITSQDASSIRAEMTMNRRVKTAANRWVDMHDWQHPKVMLFGVDMRPLKHTLVPRALERARWLSNWKETSGDPRDVQMEHSPWRQKKVKGVWVRDDVNGKVGFPWSYSDYLSRAQADGQSGVRAPELPMTGKWEGDD